MATTLRNVFFLIVFGLMAFKAMSYLAAHTEAVQPQRVAPEMRTPAGQASQPSAGPEGQELILEAGPGGHFTLDAWVEGTEVSFLVDTGASAVVLSPEDAERLGYYASSLDFNAVFDTANGQTEVALITLDDLQIGDLELDNVRAAVVQRDLPMSLLGMSALNRLDGYEVAGDRMILRW